MNCPLLSDQTADILLDYSAGRLEALRATSLETHMNICDRCSAFRMEQADLWTVLDSWEPKPVGVEFNRTLWRKIDETAAESKPWYRKLAEGARSGAWKTAFPLAAAAFVIAAGFLFDHPVARPPNTQETAAVASEADQVESTLEELQLLRQFDAASKPM